jgi:uncharacterized phage protein (TIGR01671 family)
MKMRDIKFRAWDTSEKKMHTEISLLFANDLNEVFEGLSECGCIVMQYTGLKDKNGKEIYEGDRLKCLDNDENEYLTTVSFEGGAFSIEVNGADYDYTAIGWALESDIIECEIIGNIHENPELLEVSE